MTLDLSVDRTSDHGSSTAAEVATGFPVLERVSWSARLFHRERLPDRTIRIGRRPGFEAVDEAAIWQWLGPVRDTTHSALSPDVLALVANGSTAGPPASVAAVYDPAGYDRELVEGPRWRIEVSPGVIAVRSSDPARAERAAARALEDRAGRVRLLAAYREAGEEMPDPQPARGIRSWSAKSRANMVQRLAQLDYTPLLEQDGRRAMLTVTYPGDWEAVAPDAATCHAHLKAFRKRYERRFGVPLIATWKREFQRRGAPHYHLLITDPAPLTRLGRCAVCDDQDRDDYRGCDSFRHWVAETWADIVAHPDLEERRRHLRAGTAVDYAEGARMADPRRVAVYFSKHGSYAAKDYQNVAPASWDGSVGRFWGYWGLSPAVAAVEVAPDVARAVIRTARRAYEATNRPTTERHRTRVTGLEADTAGRIVQGVYGLDWKVRRRKVRRRVRRLSRSAGFLVVNDGPAFAAQLARVAALTAAPDRVGIAASGERAPAASGARRRPLPGPLRRGTLP